MYFSALTSTIIIYLMALLSMAFYTLLERKALGYFQLRKGPNKVSLMGIPQPLADAMKLFTKEQSKPSAANMAPFLMAPSFSLFLALALWSLMPTSWPALFIPLSALLFICISSINVYTTLSAGWASNSKYALLGALRSVAQTISYEVSMALILLSALLVLLSFNFMEILISSTTWPMLFILPMFLMWFATSLAETNRTPFDFPEGESELVSGFNIEYSSGTFALIFMAEYASIIVMSLFSAIFFMGNMTSLPSINALLLTMKTMLLASMFIWIRATAPRMRYDRLMNLTWKCFLPMTLATLLLIPPLTLTLM